MKSSTGALVAVMIIAQCILVCTAHGQALVPLAGSIGERTVPTRDPAAVADLQKAVTAFGGADAIAQLNDLTVSGSIMPSPDSRISSGTFTWEAAGFEFRSQTDGPAGHRVLVTGHGRPAYAEADGTHQIPAHLAPTLLPIHMPGAILLRYLNDPLASVEFVDDQSAESTPGIQVRTSFAFDKHGIVAPPIEWTLDPQTFLPVQIKYSVIANAHPRIQWTNVVLLSDYRRQAGVMIPFHFVTITNGSPEGTFQVYSASANSRMPQSNFDLVPQGGRQ